MNEEQRKVIKETMEALQTQQMLLRGRVSGRYCRCGRHVQQYKYI